MEEFKAEYDKQYKVFWDRRDDYRVDHKSGTVEPLKKRLTRSMITGMMENKA